MRQACQLRPLVRVHIARNTVQNHGCAWGNVVSTATCACSRWQLAQGVVASPPMLSYCTPSRISGTTPVNRHAARRGGEGERLALAVDLVFSLHRAVIGLKAGGDRLEAGVQLVH